MPGIDFFVRVRNAQLQTGLAQSRKQLDTFSKDINRQFASLGGVGLTAGLTLLTKKAIDLGSRLSDQATETRTNVEALQALDFKAREAGAGSEVLVRALRNVSTRSEEAANGNRSYREALERLGLANDAFLALPTEQKLEAIGKAYSTAENQQRAYADIAIILGEKAGPKLIEVLESLATDGLPAIEKAARDAGEVIDKELIQQLDKAADQIQSFERRSTVAAGKGLGWFQAFGEGLGYFAGAGVNFAENGDPFGADSSAMFRELAEKQLERQGAFAGLSKSRGGNYSSQRSAMIDKLAAELRVQSREQSQAAAERDRDRGRAEFRTKVEENRDARAAGEALPNGRKRAPTLSSFTDPDDPFAGAVMNLGAARTISSLLRSAGVTSVGNAAVPDRPEVDEFRRIGLALTGSSGITSPETTRQTELLERMDQKLSIIADQAEEQGLNSSRGLSGFAS